MGVSWMAVKRGIVPSATGYTANYFVGFWQKVRQTNLHI